MLHERKMKSAMVQAAAFRLCEGVFTWPGEDLRIQRDVSLSERQRWDGRKWSDLSADRRHEAFLGISDLTRICLLCPVLVLLQTNLTRGSAICKADAFLSGGRLDADQLPGAERKSSISPDIVWI
jgi:hypothetical protein